MTEFALQARLWAFASIRESNPSSPEILALTDRLCALLDGGGHTPDEKPKPNKDND